MSELWYNVRSGVLRAFQRLPLGFHYAVGRVAEFFLRDVVHYRRDIVMANLARSFPDKDYSWLKSTCKASYRHMGEVFAEAMFFGGCRGTTRLHDSRLAEIVDCSDMFQTIRQKSILVLDSHFGNWEISGGSFEYFYRPPLMKDEMSPDQICVVYKELSSRFWNRFMAENRCSAIPGFQGYTESRGVVRYAYAHKDEHKCYLFPTDQYPYKGAAFCEVPSFMGQNTKAMTGGAALACKFGMAVYFMCCDRPEKGHYKIRISKICDDASQSTPQSIMTEYYRRLEEAVRERPENYLWSHRRWKARDNH